jgi:tetratricopeptide (TPR) repeat protein
MRRSGPIERAYGVILLAIFVTLAISSMRVKSPTFDETTHLASGISYVQTGDYRMNPEHPALPKRLAGWAATAAGARVPAESEAWEEGEQWDFAREVLYEGDTDWRRIVFAGRLPMVMIGVLLGVTLWVWARSLIGGGGAAVVITLYAFSPNFLAHTRLVTTDVPLAFTVVGTAACLWAAWRSGRLSWIVAAAAFVGLSMATKYSAFSYGPAWVLLILIPSENRPFRRSLVHLVVFAVAAVVFTLFLVSASYGFAFEWVTIRELGMAGRGVTPDEMGILRRVPYEMLALIPWPSAAFAEGLKDVLLHVSTGHPVYLAGMRGTEGWWWSSLVTLGAKTPLPLLILVVLAIVLLVRSPRGRGRELAFLIVPVVLVLATNMAAKLGLGVRHLLPIYPFLMLLVAWPLRGGSFTGGAYSYGLLIVALLWHAGGTLRAHPHYLAFFNEAVGGAGGGYRLLGDSNLDWGQDLSLATQRLRERGASGAILCYFGTASPFGEDFEWQILPPAQRERNRDPWSVLPTEGEQWLAMSATNRQGVFYRGTGSQKPYSWLEDVEPEETVGGSIFLYEISNEAAVHKGLLQLYRRHGLREEAGAALRRIVRRWKYDAEARRQLVRFHLERGESEEAENILFAMPNPDPSDAIWLADIRLQRGDIEGSIGILEGTIKMFPDDHESKNAFAWFLQDIERDLPRALSMIDEALRWAPEDPYYRDTKGMVLLKLEEPDAALAEFDAALAAPEGDLPAIRWHRVWALRAAGRNSEAIAEAKALRAREEATVELLEEVEAWLYDIGE